jgi:hypothetical protein
MVRKMACGVAFLAIAFIIFPALGQDQGGDEGREKKNPTAREILEKSAQLPPLGQTLVVPSATPAPIDQNTDSGTVSGSRAMETLENLELRRSLEDRRLQ